MRPGQPDPPRSVCTSGPGTIFNSTIIAGHRPETYGCGNHYTILFRLPQPCADSWLELGKVRPVAGVVRLAGLLRPA